MSSTNKIIKEFMIKWAPPIEISKYARSERYKLNKVAT